MLTTTSSVAEFVGVDRLDEVTDDEFIDRDAAPHHIGPPLYPEPSSTEFLITIWVFSSPMWAPRTWLRST